jgi:rhodanese-related sulfurtransferase
MTKIVQISPPKLAMALEKDACVLIDVREPSEHAAARIPGAVLRPLSSFDPGKLPVNPAKALVISCAAGGRSMQAAERCVEAGMRVMNLTGGLAAWRQAGLPVVQG